MFTTDTRVVTVHVTQEFAHCCTNSVLQPDCAQLVTLTARGLDPAGTDLLAEW